MRLLALTLLLLSPPTLEDTRTTLDTALEEANRTPGEAIDPLAEALAALQDFPVEVANDPELQALQVQAQLSLARSYLMAKREEEAAAILDDAIRAARGGEVDAGSYGPSLGKLYNRRVEALAAGGVGSISVTCAVPCQVYLDERAAEQELADLQLGPYRVWVAGEDPELPPQRFDLELLEDGQVLTADYAPVVEAPPVETVPVIEAPKLPERVLPRWADVTIAGSGLALMTVGAGLVSDDSNKIPGHVLIGVGAASFVVGAVLTIIDERRSERRERSPLAAHGWPLRF